MTGSLFSGAQELFSASSLVDSELVHTCWTPLKNK
jgi:hypothetical protein